MSELDIVRDLAKQALAIPTPAGNHDNSLWDRAQRLVCNVEYICRLPELGRTGPQIERFCLIAAAYFSDAGLAHYLRMKETRAKLAVSDADGDDLPAFCAEVVEEKLGPCIDNRRIKNINRIIVESGNHFTRMTEAMILSDARNLDDMGVVGIFSEFRRNVIEGKGVCDALQIWKRKVDYRYWQARLKESFRFEQVRKVAEQRLSAAECFMNQLKAEAEARDLGRLTVDSAFV